MKKSLVLLVFVVASYYSYSQALRFNGSSNYVSIGNDASLHLKSFTLEAWINIQGTGGTTGTSQGNEGGFKASTCVPLITKGRREKGSSSTDINYFFGYQASDRRLVADFEDNASGDHHPATGTTALPTNKWVHVAVTYSGNAWKFYINGALDKTVTLAASYTPQSASNVTAALATSLNSGNSSEGYFNGSMDEVRIWNLARLATDISANYKLELTSGTGLVARYGLNEGSGSSAANSAGSVNTGKLVNSPQWVLGFNQTTPANQAPVLATISSKTVTLGQTVTFTASATDPDAGQAISYSLVNAPAGASINSTSGAFSWTPTTTGTYSIIVRATDNGSPVLYDEETTTITVNPAPVANQAPVLATIGNKTVNVGQTVSFTASATDPDAGQTITFSLINQPSGATINSTSGAFSWTPAATGTYNVTVRATDNGSPVLYDDETITITVNPVPVTNNPPVLAAIGNKSVTTGQTLSFTASATDPNAGQILSFSLIGAPASATINASTGAFSWTPSASGTFTFTVRVADNGSPVLYDEESITVTVTDPAPVNHAPVLNAIGNKTATVGQALSFTATASDPDAGQTLSFSLIGAPGGASIGATSGNFSWTPATSGSFTVTVRVTDNGSPVLYDSEQITITVSNPPVSNVAPVLAAIGNKTGTVNQAISFTASATDADAGQALTFTLQNAPSGAAINASTGAFTWTPTAIGNYTFTVRVTDNGSPALSDDEQITITINNTAVISLAASADAYVRDGTYGDANYGAATTLVIKGNSSGGGFARASYLKFSLATVTSAQSAILRLYGRNTESTTTITVMAYGVNDDSWTESTITWNNAPAALTSTLTTVNVSDAAMYYDFDVTPFVQSQLAGDKIVSFLIKDPGNQNRYIEFGSKEGSSNRPQLRITPNALNQPPVLAEIGDKTILLGNVLNFAATASDQDNYQTATYSLVSAPSGAAMNATSGAFSWTPSQTGTYIFTVRVSDNGTPALTDEEQITVTVGQSSVSGNVPPDVPTSPSPANGATVTSNTASLCITAKDADNTKLRVRIYGRKKVTTDKFTVVLIPDTQFYTAEPQGKNGGNNFMFKSQTSWIVNNRVSKNIPFVGGLGDCVENGDTYEVEWKRVDTAIRTLENPATTGLPDGIPYTVAVGNHDQTANGDPLGTTTLYNQYFGASRFAGRAYYGGHAGTSEDNHYELFSASGIDFLVISPEYDLTTNFKISGGALDWMENVVKLYPKRKVIVLSHALLDLNANFSAQGAAIYSRLKIYPNFFLMVGGHFKSDNTGAGESRRSDTLNGYVVHTITQNYQARVNGGAGMLRTYEFNPQNNSIAIQSYSPYTNTFETDANSQFTINSSFAASPLPFTLLAENNDVTAGSSSCASWPGLLNNSSYEWYTEVWDGKTTTTSPLWSFNTQFASTALRSTTKTAAVAVVEEEPAADQKFSLYPNPNAGKQVTVTLPAMLQGAVHIEIADMVGNVRLRKDLIEAPATVQLEHHLPPGSYVVFVKNGSVKFSRKLVVTE